MVQEPSLMVAGEKEESGFCVPCAFGGQSLKLGLCYKCCGFYML